METRAELQAKLAEATARLEALPRADQVRHPHSVMARRTALAAKIVSLRERLSTAPVHNGLPPVSEVAPNVEESGPMTGAAIRAESFPTSNAQANPQADSGDDLQE